MQKLSHVVGRPVVASETGERVGHVADVLLDPGSHQIIGLVMAGGVFAAEHVLPYGDVQTLGKDAVIARAGRGLLDPGEWHRQGTAATRSSALRHRRVLTTSGRQLGEIDDVYVDETTGRVEGIEIRGSSFRGLLHTHSRLPHGDGLTIGADAVLVPDELATAGDARSPRR
jgi:uncharacterized protein YrrD